MSKIYFDRDVKLTALRKKVVGIIGYGNQGRAQGLNLRDSGVKVIVGNRRDAYLKMAKSDGFEAFPIREAVSRADILIIAIPDEIQEQLYKRHVGPVIRGGQVVCFASSYGYRFKCVVPPADVDVIMMSPRAMGVTVRESFEDGKGVPGFVAIGRLLVVSALTGRRGGVADLLLGAPTRTRAANEELSALAREAATVPGLVDLLARFGVAPLGPRESLT